MDVAPPSSISAGSSTSATPYFVLARSSRSLDYGFLHTTSVRSDRVFENPASNPLTETYANVVFPGNSVSEYFLCIMNACSIVGGSL